MPVGGDRQGARCSRWAGSSTEVPVLIAQRPHELTDNLTCLLNIIVICVNIYISIGFVTEYPYWRSERRLAVAMARLEGGSAYSTPSMAYSASC